MSFLSVRNLAKTYHDTARGVPVLESFDLDVDKGEMLAVVGPSGVGKSTLLHLLGGLDRPDAGTVRVEDRELTALDNDGLARFRNRHVGFVFQFHHLLPEFTAQENVAMPAWIGRFDRQEALQRATNLLAELGLSDRESHYPGQLSGGEQQRVAIARALMVEPSLLLADEPTGNLDTATSELVFALMRELHLKRNLTSVIVTHNRELASRCDRVLEMKRRNAGDHVREI